MVAVWGRVVDRLMWGCCGLWFSYWVVDRVAQGLVVGEVGGARAFEPAGALGHLFGGELVVGTGGYEAVVAQKEAVVVVLPKVVVVEQYMAVFLKVVVVVVD